MAERLVSAGVRQAGDPESADVVIVNTCGFIGEAERESLEALETFAGGKRPGQKLVAAGCLSERRGAELFAALPSIDALIGTKRWHEIGDLVRVLDRDERPTFLGPAVRPAPALRRLAAGTHAYVKIADGCNMTCSFCTIPSFKGKQSSKSVDGILDELATLARRGVREAVLIAQELGSYGVDLGGESDLLGLLRAIDRSEGPEWIRLMYLYPTALSRRLLDFMVGSPRICNYLDVPVQHSAPAVLRRMRRPPASAAIADPIHWVREDCPDFAFRTTIIVGFPGETGEEFSHLLDFVREAEFDHLGVFTYSREEGTPAAGLADQVDEGLKRERYDAIMTAQQEVALKRRRAKVGRELEVLVEETLERPARGIYRAIGRSRSEAPDVDGDVFLSGSVEEGEIVRATVVRAEPYDLFAEIVPAAKRTSGSVPAASRRS